MIGFLWPLVGNGLMAVALAPFHACGIGFITEFKFGEVTVTRPVRFRSPTQRRAFEIVGKRIRNFTAPHQVSIADVRLGAGIMVPDGYPDALWREALDVFAAAGVLEVRWILHLRSVGDAPAWDCQGNRLDFMTQELRKQYPDAHVTLGPMTTDEKDAKIGTSYAMHAIDELPEGEAMTFVVLEEEHFSPIYERPAWVSPVPPRKTR